MEYANSASEIAIIGLPTVGIRENAWNVSTVVSVPLPDSRNSGCATAELTSVMPVSAQITTVSQKVPVIDTIDCLTGFFVFAEVATIGAEPIPDSLENNPLAHP